MISKQATSKQAESMQSISHHRRTWEATQPRLPADVAPLAAEILWRAHDEWDREKFLSVALSRIVEGRGDYGALAELAAGRTRQLAQVGRERALPPALLTDVLDSDQAVVSGPWIAAPINPRGADRAVLVLHATPATAAKLQPAVASLAVVLGRALDGLEQHARDHRRRLRLEAVLEIASQWNQTQEMEPLLIQMAEAAARMLNADRASLFLWDRPNQLLVGRPALGVEGGELRVPDSAGIVGQVLQSGQPLRVDADLNQDQINRQVDEQLKYQTRTILCVPLHGRNGERFGVFEALNKRGGNFTDEDLEALVELAAHAAIALENTQERETLLHVRKQMTDQAAAGVNLIGSSPAIEALRSTIGRVANTELAVLILGENGTGKEVVSQAIHYLSRRRDQPFVAVNCAAITETLLESELFGHEKGAFTDAHQARAGKFELASGGTLFLDEIGDLSLGGQAKLLRVLEEKIVVRVGGSQPIHTDARVIAATNQNLAEMVRGKRFREDLYFRLNVVTLNLPPLRERAEDVLLLAEHFLADFSKKARRKVPKFTAEAKSRLRLHAWPGNVRELRNLMERIAYLSAGDKVEAADLAFILSPGSQGAAMPSGDQALAEATDEFQVSYITQAIAQANGNMSEAAKRLGLHRSNLYRKMRLLGMPTSD